MKNHEYQYEINTLLAKDDTGAISSFALQLDSILSDGQSLNETGIKVLDETMKLLHGLIISQSKETYDDFAEGYREGYRDSKNGYKSEY